MKTNCLVWFRKDLRLTDNPAIDAAKDFQTVYSVFIFDDDIYENKYLGGASLWWLESSLQILNKSLQNNLVILHGDSLEIIPSLCEALKIESVFWNRCYENDRIKKDTKLKKYLLESNVEAKSFSGSLLWEPWKIKNKSGNPYKVFTPFYKSGCLESTSPRLPIIKPKNLALKKVKTSLKKYKFKYLIQKNHWSSKFKKYWEIGEDGANSSLEKFLKNGSKNYSIGRNFPSLENVSRLSPYLHWGQISPHQVWHAAKNKMEKENKKVFLSELAWREFSYHLLYNFPDLQLNNLKRNFDDFPWLEDNDFLEKWRKGQTGYPIIDAGMRELWETGYMHNRVRMITSSFLVKNLLMHWKKGEKWFWECLLDADAASNSASWQWVAGTGTDSTPFFRIFNPITQSMKFDNEATYIRKFVPELKGLPTKLIFCPFEYDNNTLEQYGIVLGKNYPLPVIDYATSRKRALDTYTKFINKN